MKRTFEMNGKQYTSMMDIARELGVKRIYTKDFDKYGIIETTGQTVVNTDAKVNTAETTVDEPQEIEVVEYEIPEEELAALETIKQMDGWEEDGLATGNNDGDVFYAVNHEVDDNHKELFFKTTFKDMVDGTADDDNGTWMTAQEVLAEVKKIEEQKQVEVKKPVKSTKKVSKKTEKKEKDKDKEPKVDHRFTRKTGKPEEIQEVQSKVSQMTIIEFNDYIKHFSLEALIQMAETAGVKTWEDIDNEPIRKMRLLMEIKGHYFPNDKTPVKPNSCWKKNTLEELLELAQEHDLTFKASNDPKIQRMWVIMALKEAGLTPDDLKAKTQEEEVDA